MLSASLNKTFLSLLIHKVRGYGCFSTHALQRKKERRKEETLNCSILEGCEQREREKFLFNNALNIFYLRLYGVRHMVKYHTDSERGNLLPPHGLLFPINSKGSFICTIPQTGLHIP